jgi:hypothetical protein
MHVPFRIRVGALVCFVFCVGATFSLNRVHAQSAVSTDTASTAAPYGNCPAPSSPGVKVCFPAGTSIDSPMLVIASGTGAGGPVKYMQLYVDGKKLTQVSGNVFDRSVALAVGTHRIVLAELDTTGASIKSAPRYVTVQASTSNIACNAPSSPGVNMCVPAPGSCQVANWTTVVAAATPTSGTVSRMELWVNGAKLFNSNGDLLNTNLGLRSGTRIVVQAVDSNGGTVKSAPTYVNPC